MHVPWDWITWWLMKLPETIHRKVISTIVYSWVKPTLVNKWKRSSAGQAYHLGVSLDPGYDLEPERPSTHRTKGFLKITMNHALLPLISFFLLPPNHRGEHPQWFPATLACLVNESQEGKFKTNWRVTWKHGPSFGQLEPQFPGPGEVGKGAGCSYSVIGSTHKRASDNEAGMRDSVYQRYVPVIWWPGAVQSRETAGPSLHGVYFYLGRERQTFFYVMLMDPFLCFLLVCRVRSVRQPETSSFYPSNLNSHINNNLELWPTLTVHFYGLSTILYALCILIPWFSHHPN